MSSLPRACGATVMTPATAGSARAHRDRVRRRARRRGRVAAAGVGGGERASLSRRRASSYLESEGRACSQIPGDGSEIASARRTQYSPAAWRSSASTCARLRSESAPLPPSACGEPGFAHARERADPVPAVGDQVGRGRAALPQRRGRGVDDEHARAARALPSAGASRSPRSSSASAPPSGSSVTRPAGEAAARRRAPWRAGFAGATERRAGAASARARSRARCAGTRRTGRAPRPLGEQHEHARLGRGAVRRRLGRRRGGRGGGGRRRARASAARGTARRRGTARARGTARRRGTARGAGQAAATGHARDRRGNSGAGGHGGGAERPTVACAHSQAPKRTAKPCEITKRTETARRASGTRFTAAGDGLVGAPFLGSSTLGTPTR